MDKKLISEYLAQPDYKNTVLAGYLKDNLKDTLSFISTCSKEELVKVYAVIENVVMHFMDIKIVNIFKSRKGQLQIKISDNLSMLNNILTGHYNERLLLIKSIVDEIDPLQLIKNNASYTCYNGKINKLFSKINIFTLEHITYKVKEVFKSADPDIIQKLSEQLTNAFKDGRIKKYIFFERNYIVFHSYFNKDEFLKINLFTHGCDYVNDDLYDNLYDGFDDYLYDDTYHDEYSDDCAINLSPFLLKLLCNELSSTSFDLNNCKPEEFISNNHFETIYTYKNGKEHILLIDSKSKRYLYVIKDIDYFNYINEKKSVYF